MVGVYPGKLIYGIFPSVVLGIDVGFLKVNPPARLLILGFDIKSLFTINFFSSLRIDEGVVFRLNLI